MGHLELKPKMGGEEEQHTFGAMHYIKGALAGGICCSITHGALCPVDVVKTRMQLDPQRYKGLVSGMRQVIATEGVGALATGLGATAAGYFVQGWFKFGGVELFKINMAQALASRKHGTIAPPFILRLRPWLSSLPISFCAHSKRHVSARCRIRLSRSRCPKFLRAF